MTIPKAARAHTFQGADAFARFYFAQVNKAWTTPDPTALRGLYTADCATCDGFIDNAVDLVSLKQHYDRDPVSVQASAWLPESTKATAVVDVVFRQEPAKIVGPDGSTVTQAPKKDGTFRCHLVWHGGSWSLKKIQEVTLR